METKRDYVLVTPSEGIVKQYCSFWGLCNSAEKIDWQIPLFKGVKADIRQYINEDEFKSFGEKDNDIKTSVESNDFPAVLTKINSVYHTRLKVTAIASATTFDDVRNMSIDEFVDLCKRQTGVNAYSFATKLFSFIDGTKYPIMDSYVATLLEYYLTKKGIAVAKTDWGNYGEFKKAYAKFVDNYGLTGLTYKQLDIFFWTYGKVIHKYWKEAGVLSFETIPYKCPQNND